jgi:hypothetical protein
VLPPRRDALDIFGLVRRFIGVIAAALEIRAAFVKIDRHDRRRIHFGGIAPPFGSIGRAGIVFAKVEREVFLRCRSGLKRAGAYAREFVGGPGNRLLGHVRPIVDAGRKGRGSQKELLGMARFRAPDRPTPRAADLPSVGGQAGQLHVIGSSAGWADNQHRRISGASRSWEP